MVVRRSPKSTAAYDFTFVADAIGSLSPASGPRWRRSADGAPPGAPAGAPAGEGPLAAVLAALAVATMMVATLMAGWHRE